MQTAIDGNLLSRYLQNGAFTSHIIFCTLFGHKLCSLEAHDLHTSDMCSLDLGSMLPNRPMVGLLSNLEHN